MSGLTPSSEPLSSAPASELIPSTESSPSHAPSVQTSVDNSSILCIFEGFFERFFGKLY
jgi:hypothetical protein